MISRIAAALLFAALSAGPVAADERYAVVIAGASGGEPYATKLRGWQQSMVTVLRDALRFDEGHIIALGETGDGARERSATRVNVLAALDRMKRLGAQDLLLVVLLGHGTFDGESAKFNLVGPDLDAGEWREALKPIRARIVFVNASGASFPFLEALAAPRRIVITATETTAQRYDTVFADYFIKAFSDPDADLDKDGRISIFEAFNAASRGVKQYYDQRGELATERALLDDTGRGAGKSAGGVGPDGAIAAHLFLDNGDGAVATTDADLADLYQRRATIEAQVEELRARKPLMTPDEYAAEFERVMIELAKVSRDIRKKKT